MIQEGPSLEKELRRWVRWLTAALARVRRPPARIEPRIGAGVHLLLQGGEGSSLALQLTLAGGTDDAYFRGRYTALRYLGDAAPGPMESQWLAAVRAGLRRAEEQPGWPEFLSRAQRTPAVAQARASSGDRITSGDAFLLRVTTRCQARCSFCNARGVLEDLHEEPSEIRQVLDEAARRGYASVSFTGGEPTLRPDLATLVSWARDAGLSRVDLQTNGLRLAPKRIAALVDAGLTSIFLSLHSAAPAWHDAVLKVPGAHTRALRAAERCRAAGLEVCVNHVITRESLSQVVEYLELLARRLGPVGVRLSFVAPQGGGAEHPELMPTLREVSTALAQGLDRARSLGLDARVPGLCGVPPCLLPGYEEHFDELQERDPPPRLPSRAQGPACVRCLQRGRCSGFWRAYLERHGTEELSPPPHWLARSAPDEDV